MDNLAIFQASHVKGFVVSVDLLKKFRKLTHIYTQNN
jgi:hypothetical protein